MESLELHRKIRKLFQARGKGKLRHHAKIIRALHASFHKEAGHWNSRVGSREISLSQNPKRVAFVGLDMIFQ